jgi:hypothetical protein
MSVLSSDINQLNQLISNLTLNIPEEKNEAEVYEQKGEQTQALILHGQVAKNTFKLPNNIRIISYNCPVDLYHPSAPVFHCIRQGTRTIEDILTEMSYYPHTFFDIGVHDPQETINNINLYYNKKDPSWKLGYLVPKSKIYTPSNEKTINRIMKQSEKEATQYISSPCITKYQDIMDIDDEEFITTQFWLTSPKMKKSYRSGIVNDYTYKLDEMFQQLNYKVLDLETLVFLITKLYPNKFINLIVWVCKSNPHNITFLYGQSLIQKFTKPFSSQLKTKLTGTFSTNLFNIDYDISIHFEPKIIFTLTELDQKKISSDIRLYILKFMNEITIYIYQNLIFNPIINFDFRKVRYNFTTYIDKKLNLKYITLLKKLFSGLEFTESSDETFVIYNFQLTYCTDLSKPFTPFTPQKQSPPPDQRRVRSGSHPFTLRKQSPPPDQRRMRSRSHSPSCYKGSKTYKKYISKGRRRSRSRRTGSPRKVRYGPKGGRYHLMRCSKNKNYSPPSEKFIESVRSRSLSRRVRSPYGA